MLEPRRVSKIGQRRTVVVDLGAELRQPLRQLSYRHAHSVACRHDWMGIDDVNPEILEIVVPRGRQCQAIADSVTRLVRSGYHGERKSKVGGVSSHRTRHSQVAAAWHGWSGRQIVSAKRDQTESWLVPIDTAEMRRYANG